VLSLSKHVAQDRAIESSCATLFDKLRATVVDAGGKGKAWRAA
jgi:hypothetical protein